MSCRSLILLSLVLILLLSWPAESATKTKSRKQRKQQKKPKPKKPSPSASRGRATANFAFILQSVSDKWLCFAGDKMVRCGLDTVWYQNGYGNTNNMHLKPIDEIKPLTSSTASCLIRRTCDEGNSSESMHLTIGNCSQVCSSMNWALEKEVQSDTTVITFNKTQLCVSHDSTKNSFLLDSCVETKYSKFMQMQISKTELLSMNSTTQKLIDAALDANADAVVDFFAQKKIDVNSRNWEDSTVLQAASRGGSVDIVEFLISKQQADVNLHDKKHRNALMETALKGHLEVVKLLIATGAEADSTDLSGATPLMMAAEYGHVQVVEYLLDQHTVDVTKQDLDGWSALTRACQVKVDAKGAAKRLETVQALLAAGANVDSPTNDGDTPLIIATSLPEADLSIIKILLENKADVNRQGAGKVVPLHTASFHGNAEIVELLIAAGANINIAEESNVTSLIYAAAGGKEAVVQLLLKSGAEVNSKHSTGGTALHEAAINGSIPIVEMLIAASADVMMADNDKTTVLHAAAEKGHTRICEILLDKGVPIDIISDLGATALMHATFANETDTIRLLLERKANVNILLSATAEWIEKTRLDPAAEPYEHELSALMVACKFGRLPIVQMLVEAGAEINRVDAEGRTPLLHAAYNNNIDTEMYLLQQGASPNDIMVDKMYGDRSMLLFAVANNNTELALLLLAKGANVSFVDEDGSTIATHAAFLGNMVILDELLARGADVFTANIDGADPLITASAEGHLDVVAALLSTKSVNLNGKDVDGTNALMAASVRGHKNVAKLLIAAGMNMNAQNVEGHTALMFAYNGKLQAEHLLNKYKEFMKVTADNTTKLISDAIVQHSELITLLRRSGADTTIRDNLNHIAADFDFNRNFFGEEYEEDVVEQSEL